MPRFVLLAAALLAAAISSAQAQTASDDGRVQIQVDNAAAPDKPNVYNGTVTWRTEQRSDGGANPETVIVGDLVTAPGGLKAQLVLRHNSDTSKPAQFLAEMKFDVPAGFPEGDQVAVLSMNASRTPGEPGFALDGVLLKVTSNVFLMAMADPFNEKGREARMLRVNPWFHIYLTFNDGRHAIVTFEKGTNGEKIFKDTLALWGQ